MFNKAKNVFQSVKTKMAPKVEKAKEVVKEKANVVWEWLKNMVKKAWYYTRLAAAYTAASIAFVVVALCEFIVEAVLGALATVAVIVNCTITLFWKGIGEMTLAEAIIGSIFHGYLLAIFAPAFIAWTGASLTNYLLSVAGFGAFYIVGLRGIIRLIDVAIYRPVMTGTLNSLDRVSHFVSDNFDVVKEAFVVEKEPVTA